jgi:hypothetical protein
MMNLIAIVFVAETSKTRGLSACGEPSIAGVKSFFDYAGERAEADFGDRDG